MTADPDSALGVRYRGKLLPALSRSGSRDLPMTDVRHRAREELEAPAEVAVTEPAVYGIDWPDGRPFLRIWQTAAGGYRIETAEHGLHLIAPDGAWCESSLPADPLLAARLVVAQVLPLVSTLRGHEVLHAAGVVASGGRVIVLVAPSGTGKSTTLVHLLALGLGFFGDDVVAVGPGSPVLAHAGPRMLNVAQETYDALPQAHRERLGTPVGHTDKLHLDPPGPTGPLPLGGVVLLSRSATPASSVEPIRPDPRELLDATYIRYVRTPARLLAQMDAVAAIAREVPIARAHLGGDGPAAAARAIATWAHGLC